MKNKAVLNTTTFDRIALKWLKNETEVDLMNTKKSDTRSNEKNKAKSQRINQSDIILQHFKDYPEQSSSYKDVGEWIKEEVANGSFKDIKDHEKILRSLEKEGKIIKMAPGYLKYE